ncbi:MAG: hypothetical protein KDB53_07820, partial [Planctomycetes bacterium]|nr:hypothetical protein [Planctomycetota bacterium]
MALKSPEKPVGFGRGARSRIAANVILASVLAVVFAVFVNYFVAQLGDDHDLRLDMTREKRSELDPTTKELIRSIETPIDCYLVFGMDDTLRRAARMTPDARTPDTGLVQGEYRPFLANLAEQVRFLLEEA